MHWSRNPAENHCFATVSPLRDRSFTGTGVFAFRADQLSLFRDRGMVNRRVSRMEQLGTRDSIVSWRSLCIFLRNRVLRQPRACEFSGTRICVTIFITEGSVRRILARTRLLLNRSAILLSRGVFPIVVNARVFQGERVKGLYLVRRPKRAECL